MITQDITLSTSPYLTGKLHALNNTYDIQSFLRKQIEDKEIIDFWYSVHFFEKSAFPSKIFEDVLIEGLSHSFIKHIHKNNLLDQYLNGLSFFLSQQKTFSISKMQSFIESPNDLFIYSILYGTEHQVSVISPYKIKIDFSDYEKQAFSMMENHNLSSLYLLMKYTDNVSYNNSNVLRSCAEKNIYNDEFFTQIISEFNLNLNEINASSSYSKTYINFIHLLSTNFNQEANNLFQSIFKKFGSSIKLDIIQHYFHRQYGSIISGNIIDSIMYSEGTQLAKLDRLTVILETCLITPKLMSQISSYILQPKYIANNYDHPIYSVFFKHSILNSDSFDRASVFNTILKADNTSSVKAIRQGNNYTVNPTVFLLKIFFEHVQSFENKSNLPPFEYWAKQQSRQFCEDTALFLLSKYRSDISLTTQYSPQIVQFLQHQGINAIQKPAFFHKMLQLFQPGKENNIIHAKAVTPTLKLSDKISFDTILFTQIKDPEILKFVSAIQLNAEQFEILCNQDFTFDNQHYINTLLPKFLNKTIENYLHFSSIDECEAKENVLVQLQLLNKKTFEVLKEGLQEEKNQLAKNSRVVGNIIKQIS